eukprot:jgi/Mesen1/2322/ME000155S01412
MRMAYRVETSLISLHSLQLSRMTGEIGGPKGYTPSEGHLPDEPPHFGESGLLRVFADVPRGRKREGTLTRGAHTVSTCAERNAWTDERLLSFQTCTTSGGEGHRVNISYVNDTCGGQSASVNSTHKLRPASTLTTSAKMDVVTKPTMELQWQEDLPHLHLVVTGGVTSSLEAREHSARLHVRRSGNDDSDNSSNSGSNSGSLSGSTPSPSSGDSAPAAAPAAANAASRRSCRIGLASTLSLSSKGEHACEYEVDVAAPLPLRLGLGVLSHSFHTDFFSTPHGSVAVARSKGAFKMKVERPRADKAKWGGVVTVGIGSGPLLGLEVRRQFTKHREAMVRMARRGGSQAGASLVRLAHTQGPLRCSAAVSFESAKDCRLALDWTWKEARNHYLTLRGAFKVDAIKASVELEWPFF